MLPNNRKIHIAILAGLAVIAGGYVWYRRRKRSLEKECTDIRNGILLEDIDKHDDKGEHTSSHLATAEKHIDKEPSFHIDDDDDDDDDDEDEPQPDEISDVEEVLNETKQILMKHMFLITEGMTPSERLQVYEKLAKKINVIQRGEGLYDVKWRP